MKFNPTIVVFGGIGSLLRSIIDPAEEKKIIINFNWASVLFYCFFISYGFFAARTPSAKTFIDAINVTLPISAVLVLILILFSYLSWKKRAEFEDSIVLQPFEVFSFLITLCLLLFISFNYLNLSLFSDEIFYSFEAHRVGYGLFTREVMFPWVGDLPVALLIQGFGLLTLVMFTSLVFHLRKVSWLTKALVFSVLLITYRVLISRFGGSMSPHPPMNLLPIFVSGSIFGISDFGLKLSSFIPYVLYVVALQKMLSRKFDSTISLLMALTIATIPLTLFLSTVVEQALWSSICFSIIMLDLVTSDRPNYLRLVSIASIATLFRQPSFVVFLPILMSYIWRERGQIESKQFCSRFILLTIPSIFFLPFLFASLIYGTPSTSSLVNEDLGFLIFRPIQALISGQIHVSILNSVPVWWAIFIPIAFLPFFRHQPFQRLLFFIFFIALILIFYSINPILWGEAKYQVEYAVPFAVVGFILSFLSLREKAGFKLISRALLPVLMLLNIYEFISFPKDNKPVDQLIETVAADKRKYNSGFKMMATFPYAFSDAHRAMKNAGFASNSYSLGITYGIFPQVLVGYTVNEIISASKISRDQSMAMKEYGVPWTTGSVHLIELDPRIKAVLIGFVFPNKAELIEDFKRNGWLTLGEFRDSTFGSTVFVLSRGRGPQEIED